MRVKRSLLGAFTVAIALVELATLGQWLKRYETYPALSIQAAYDVLATGHPVYAQFVYTQSITLPRAHEVVALVVPLGSPPGSTEAIQITLQRGDETLASWSPHHISAQAEEINLPLGSPLFLQGPLAVVFSAPAASNDQAVRVFVEPADDNYPDGNYRIANNEKKGDIALTVVARRHHWESLREQWRAQPLDLTARGLVGLTVLLVLAMTPWTIDGAWRHGASRGQARSE